MSDLAGAISPLGGRSYEGFARIAEAGLVGMITIRADLATPALAEALGALGLALPAMRRVSQGGEGLSLAWMSPDELLLICSYEGAEAIAQSLSTALAGQHALVINVSDARALFTIEGPRAQEVLMKLAPVDFAHLADDEIRRTRAAQVAVAFWRSTPDRFSLICFRSVASYMMGLLEVSSRKGGELF